MKKKKKNCAKNGEFYLTVTNAIRTCARSDHPISGKALGFLLQITDSEIRKYINEARSLGAPICSSRHGYFYSTEPEYIKKTVESMQRRVGAQEKAICGLKQYMKDNQIRVWLLVESMFVCENYSSCIGCNYQYADRIDDLNEEFRDCSHLIEVAEVKRVISVGDVVQFDEKHKWRGSLGIVSDIKKLGNKEEQYVRYMVSVPIPGQGTAYIFVSSKENSIKRIGEAVFLPTLWGISIDLMKEKEAKEHQSNKDT